MQQRIMLMNNWNTLEQVCLASAVGSIGDNNWTTVCGLMKSKFPLIERPSNWFTPEACEAQYKFLSDKYVKLEISCERPVNQILQNLKQIAKQESQIILEQEKKYLESKDIIEKFCNNEIDMDTAGRFYEDALRKSKEREESMRKLKEGLRPNDTTRLDEDKLNISKSPVKQDNKSDGNSPLSTSPLLSSLLNNPPAVQYRPTLSTASFIPSKTSPCTTRSSIDKVQTSTSDVNYISIISTDVGNQSNTPSLYSTSQSAVRRLDFQETPEEASEKLPKDVPVVKDAANTEDTTMDNLNLIPGGEEYLPDAEIPQDVWQALGSLSEHKMLEKVLEELTSDKEVISKTLNSVSIPLDESYILNSSTAKDCETVSIPLESSQKLADSSNDLISNEFKNSSGQFSNRSVVTVQNDLTREQNDETNASESQPFVETVNVNSESPFTTTPNSTFETVEVKTDSESLIEYLNTSAIEKAQNWSQNKTGETQALEVEKEAVTLVTNEEIYNENHKSIVSLPGIQETSIIPTNESTERKKSNSSETLNGPDEILIEKNISSHVIEKEREGSCEEGGEISKVSDISLSLEEIQDVSISEFKGPKPEEKNIVETAELTKRSNQEKSVGENVDRSAASSRTASPPVEIEQTVETKEDTIVDTPFITSEKNKDTDIVFDELIREKTDPTDNLNDNDFKPLVISKNLRKYSRRRRSTVSEVNENELPKTISSEEQDSGESATNIVRDLNITIKDFQKEGLDSDIVEELLQPKDEPMEDPVEEMEKDNKSSESKSRSKSNRRSNVRSQSSTPKSSDVPSSSRSQDIRKKTLLLVHQRLNAHKYSNTFQKPITNKTVSGYEDVIYCPIDLQTIKRKIDTKQISVTEFQRDILLMINNAKMYNHVNSQVHGMACEVQKEALQNILLTVQNLGEGVVLETNDVADDRARKRPSIESIKRDLKTNKRAKSTPKDDSVPLKKIKMEDQDGSSNQS